MPFTTRNIVRTHLMAAALSENSFANVPVTLVGTSETQVPHANLLADTVILKWIANESPVRQAAVVLTNYVETSLSHNYLVARSLIAADDDGLGTVYAEEKDYRVNELEGKIERVPGTAIGSGSPIVVWYDHYAVFEEGADYRINYEDGSLSRTSGSTIPDGATVLIDYSVAEGSADNLLVDQVIVEAEDLIARCLREGYTVYSTDLGLQSGATYLSLSLFARGRAALTLTTFRGTDAHSRAKEWQTLADNWWKLAWDTLAPFTLPYSIRTPLVN